MMRYIQKLLTVEKTRTENVNPEIKTKNEELAGFLTKEDLRKLKNLKAQKSAYRKITFKNWNCSDCGHTFYYKIIRCPLCESNKIEELVKPTQYEFSNEIIREEIMSGQSFD